MEMIKEVGYVKGIENYSQYISVKILNAQYSILNVQKRNVKHPANFVKITLC